MRQALLLNGDYTPLRIIPINRAVVLVLSQKAEIVKAGEGELHSEYAVYPIPSVIRLCRVVKIPYMARVKLTKTALIKRDHGLCGYCGKAGENIDHILPRSLGGRHEWRNVVWACKACNYRKADHYPLEAVPCKKNEKPMVLRIKPYTPEDRLWLIIAIGTALEVPEWEPYLAKAA